MMPVRLANSVSVTMAMCRRYSHRDGSWRSILAHIGKTLVSLSTSEFLLFFTPGSLSFQPSSSCLPCLIPSSLISGRRTQSFSPVTPADWKLLSLLIWWVVGLGITAASMQTGDESVVCVNVKRVCVCHLSVPLLQAHVLSLIRQTGVEAVSGERGGLGCRSEARLRPVCTDVVWHLSARDTHTRRDTLRHSDTVRECWRRSHGAGGRAHSAYIDFFPPFFFPAPVPLPISFMGRLPNFQYSLSPLHLRLATSVTSSSLCADLPGCANQLIGIHI